MKILLASQMFYPELISTGQTLTELGEALSDLGVEIEVICAPPTLVDHKAPYPRLVMHHGIRIVRLWSTRFPKLNLLGKVLNHITFSWSVFWYLISDRSGRSLLVPTNPPFLIWACVLASVFRSRKMVYVLFDLYPETPIRLGVMSENGVLAKGWRLLNRWVFQRVSSIVVIGRCMKKIVRDYVPHHKLESISLWSDPKLVLHEGPSSFRKKWDLENKFVVLYSGNMARFHEFDTILNAALKLKDHPDIRFVFVGDGYHKKTILSFIERYLLLNCQMHDYVARDDLPDLLALGDVGLVSLLDGFEGLSVPSKTFGLMAAGVPVLGVLPRDSEIAHLVSEYHAGYVVSSGDVDGFVENVMTLFSSPVLLGEMADRGQTACLKHHRLSLIAQQYVDLLTRL